MDRNARIRIGIATLIVAFLAATLTYRLAAAQTSPSVSYNLVATEAEGVKYTPECLTECHLPLRITFGQAYAVDSAEKFAPKLERGTGDWQFDSLEFRRLVTVTEERTRWIPDVQCSPWDEIVYDEANQTEHLIAHDNCTDFGYEEKYTAERSEWQPFTPEGFAFDAGKEYLVDLVGKRKMRLGGEGSAVDAQVCFGDRCTTEYAWWNSSSYANRVNITSTTTFNLPFFINGSGGWCSKHIVVNTKGDNRLAIYYNNCTDFHVIANDSEVWPHDDTSQQPTATSRLVYPSGMLFFPFDINGSYEDRGQTKTNGTCSSCPTWVGGRYGGAYEFNSNSSQYLTLTNSTPVDRGSYGGFLNHTSGQADDVTAISNIGSSVEQGALRARSNGWHILADAGNAHTVLSPIELKPKNFHNIYGIWDEGAATTLRTFANGTEVGTSAAGITIETASTGWYLGRRWDGPPYWSGDMDNMLFWNEIINASQASALYNNSIGLNYLLGPVETAAPYANESEGRAAIEAGIAASTASSGTIDTDRQVTISYLNGTQKLGTFDKVLAEGNQRWLFNYNTTGESYTGMEGISPALFIWENESLTAAQITAQVSSLINSTNT